MLTDLAIRRPVTTAMAALAIVILGAMSFLRLGTELFPDVSMPFVTIVTVWPGAGPVDVEGEVTSPIEDAVAGINGVDELFSRSAESVSLVFVQFTMETDVDAAVQEVREQVERARRQLPAQAEPPEIARFDVRSAPVLTYSITAGGDPDRTRRLAEDVIKPAIEQIPGVALVRVLGGRTREIAVRLDPDRLEAAGLAAGQVYQRLRQENVSVPAGRFESGATEIGVRVDARIQGVEDIRRVVVSGGQAEELQRLGRTVAALARGGQSGVASLPERDETPVTVGDLAEVTEGYAEERAVVRLNGREAVVLEIVKRAGGNNVEIAAAVAEVLARLRAELPDDVRLDLIRDEAAPVIDNAHDVERALVIGGLMAVAVILFFLVDLRGTFISALALPTSVVGTFAIMYAFGFTLNILTLLGLALAIGLLIDDSVVVREAITRRLEAGDEPFTAAREGTREIRLAVLSTTLTVCAVFIPVAFMSGMVGQFFKEFGLTVAGAVLLSLFVAFTVDPMLSARLVKRRGASAPAAGGLARALRSGHDKVDRAYRRALAVSLRHPFVTLLAGASSLAASVLLAPVLGFEFIPAQDRGRFIVNMRFPAGTSLAESSRRALVFERGALEVEDVTAVQCTVGEDEDPRAVRCNVLARPRTERSRSLADIKEDCRRVLARVPQATVAISNPPLIEAAGDYPPIVMQVRGPDLERLREHAEQVAEVMRQVPGTSDVDVRYDPGLPELAVRVDRDRARDRGLSAEDVALQARLALHGAVAGTVRRDRQNLEVRVVLGEGFRRSPAALDSLLVHGLRGPVRLGDVAEVEQRTGPVAIAHESRRRQVSVHSQVEGRPLGDVMAELRGRLRGLELDDGYDLLYRGMQERMVETNESMQMALLLALLFIYVILASQFESLTHPFTIVLSLPLGLLGAFLALYAWGSAISLPAYLGLILLIGLCAKNGILLVDGAIVRMRDDHLEPREAMLAAGPRRLRPILMTSAAMIFGMLPTALARDVGSEFRFPMAAAVIGGVVSNTLLTLFVLPVLFVGMERAARWTRRLAGVRPKTGHGGGPPSESCSGS